MKRRFAQTLFLTGVLVLALGIGGDLRVLVFIGGALVALGLYVGLVNW